MTIPTREECLKLMNCHGMLDNIVSHSLEVTRVALSLSAALNKKGQRIDLALVEAASLLHDLAKTECLRTREDHAKTALRILKELGYGRVAEVVGQHVWLWNEGNPSSVSEEEVVNYADKRVQHDKVVSLNERFSDLKDRYGNDERTRDYWQRLEKRIYDIEDKILLILHAEPRDLEFP